MNKIYLFLILIGLSLAGCHEVTVGYMKTGHAAYPIDSLQIFDSTVIKTEITRLEAMSITVADSLQLVLIDLTAQCDSVREVYDLQFINDITLPGIELDRLLEDSLSHVAEIIELKEKIAQNKEKIRSLEELYDDLQLQLAEVSERLANLDPSEGEPDVSALEALNNLKLRAEKHIAWATSEIEGVDGTAPIFYSIADIWAEKGGDADIFRSELTIKGGGRMEVPYDFKAPAGYYHVSVTIRNEGYTRTLENMFTFIINPVAVK